MLEIKQFRFARDNLAYLVFGKKTALAVDGGAVGEISAFIRQQNLELRYVANTHMHPDHTPGNSRLLQETKAEFVDALDITKRSGEILVDGEKIEVIQTPGHSLDSVVFAVNDALITGDTLFNGTVGNCFSGDLNGFYRSIKRILEFPPETKVYSGHDYVEEALAFARVIEPDNPVIEEFEGILWREPLYSTIADELKVNPFLRFNEPSIVQFLTQRKLPVDTELDRWNSIMQL